MDWDVSGPLLKFLNLDGQYGFTTTYSLGWNFLDEGDKWTERFGAFKKGQVGGIKGACAVLPDAVSRVNFGSGPILLVSAISSADTQLRNGSALHVLGRALSDKTGWDWNPGLLSKRVHKPIHSIRAQAGEQAALRDAEVSNAYSCEALQRRYTSVVVMDDLVTRCSTISDIVRAVRIRQRDIHAVGLVLAKNDRKSYMREHYEKKEVSNTHIPKELAYSWDNA
jgi:hypothetical protein